MAAFVDIVRTVCIDDRNSVPLRGRSSHEGVVADDKGRSYSVVFATWLNGQFVLQQVRPNAQPLHAQNVVTLLWCAV